MAYTYREVCQEGTGMLDFLPDARIDARRLLEHVCGTSIQTLLADPDRPVSRQEYEKYQELIARRQQREPLAYILGEQEFMGLSFRVSPHVLIPGQDTENLVEEAMRELTDGSRILDLCTGSGCILLSIPTITAGSGRIFPRKPWRWLKRMESAWAFPAALPGCREICSRLWRACRRRSSI